MKVAVIDLGTNTFNLVVASRSAEGTLIIHFEEEIAVGLGKGGIENGEITAEAFDRGLEALNMLGIKALSLGAEHIRGFGTSALRNARNGAAFVSAAEKVFSVLVTIIPGEEEAGLILDGVRLAVEFGKRPQLVMDIGGGSIEFILATDRALMWKRSFELGTARLLDRFHPSDPMTVQEHLRIAAHLDAQLEPLWAVMDRHWPQTLVGSAGSFDSLAAMVAALGGEEHPKGRIAMQFSTTIFDELKDGLLSMPREQRSAIAGLPPYRVDSILPALIVAERVISRGIGKVCWSRYALKEGAAWRALNELTL
ncbi:MAG: hypothetical protein ACOH13_02685 [Flavobacteriales bacterium]